MIAQYKSGSNSLASYLIAQLYADLGEKDHAFEWLAYQEHSVWMILIRVDYSFDPIRSDPRYAELVRKLGFPQ